MRTTKFTVLAVSSVLPSYVYAATATLECEYPIYSNGTSIKASNQRFALTFIIDEERKTAYMIGNNGSTEVTVIPSTEGPMGSLLIRGARAFVVS